MASDLVASRYAQAAFEAATAEQHVDEALKDLTLLGSLIEEHPDLRELLYNPDVDPTEKVGLLDRALRGTWSALVQAFVEMVVSLGRAESLPEIIMAFREAVDAAQGRLRIVVRSAHPLPVAVLERLRTSVAHREHKEIELTAEVEPELLGGVQVLLDHREIDGSVRRQLSDLREQLKAVRVY